jgi:hypothetical protein
MSKERAVQKMSGEADKGPCIMRSATTPVLDFQKRERKHSNCQNVTQITKIERLVCKEKVRGQNSVYSHFILTFSGRYSRCKPLNSNGFCVESCMISAVIILTFILNS